MSELQIERPERWDVPFSRELNADGSADMSDDDVERILKTTLFANLDPEKFRGKVTLPGIIKNDARLLRCREGEIIVRKGDWGNSAFFLLSGSVCIDVGGAGETLPSVVLGRKTVKQKGLFESVAQLWRRNRVPEAREVGEYVADSRIETRGDGTASRIYLQDVPAILKSCRTVRIKAQELFGEQSALGRIERTATVFADGDCELLEMRWQGLRDIMRRDTGLRETVDTLFRERGLYTFLRNSPYFSHLLPDPDSRVWFSQRWNQLIKEAEFDSYGVFDKVDKFKKLAEFGTSTGLKNEAVIAEEGSYPNGVILIRSGLARVSRQHFNGHQTVGYLTPGQAFGVEEVTEGWKNQTPVPLKYSLRAIGYVTVVRVATPLFEKLVLEPEEPTASSPPPVAETTEQAKIDTGLLEFLVERRIVNGSQTMLIDLDRCTRCDDCVRACAATHDNNPRFLRHGPVHGKYMVANACMHCNDPVCMIECPTGAIHRNLVGGEIVINDQTCVGCSACANNCPYDAIRMVQVSNADGDFIRDQNQMPIDKATKCDLCAEQLTGPACQNACPHDALIRLDMGKLESVANWSNQ